MQWQEVGIILSVRSFSENARIVTFFNKSRGKTSAILKNSKFLIQSGDVCDILWRGGSSERLGIIKIETVFSPFCHVINDQAKILAIDSACSMCSNGLFFADPHVEIFSAFTKLLFSIANDNWIFQYVFFEMALLAEVGYGLDLSKCAVSGEKSGLKYISPKTGCAVTEKVGLPYKDKLLPLPQFMITEERNSEKEARNSTKHDIFCALNITGHFLKIYFCGINGKDLPLSRKYLVDGFIDCVDNAA